MQGYGREVGWVDLAEAALAVRAGALWVATNTDRTLPSPRGPLPGNGSLVAVLRTALDREPDVVVGKPEPALFEEAVRRDAASRPLVVGDRLDTDIEGAVGAGLDSLLVLTGVSQPRTWSRHRRSAGRRTSPRTWPGSSTTWRRWRSPPRAPVGGWPTDELDGHGDPIAALRTICAAAWAGTGRAAASAAPNDEADAALRELGL